MTSELKIIIGIIAATAGIFAGSIGNTLSDNITYWFVKKGKRPPAKPLKVWVLFFFTASISVILGSVAAFSPSPTESFASLPSASFQITEAVAKPSVTPATSQPTIAPLTPSPSPTFPTVSTVPVWSGVLSLRKASENDINTDNPISIWDANLITVQDMQVPGTMTYSGSVRVDEEYLFSTFWCATNAHQLNLNLPNIETSFFVNGEIIPKEKIYTYNHNKSTGWSCSYDVIILGGWLKDIQYTLQVKRVLKSDLSDGQSTYPSGTYINELIVKVE